MAQTPQRPGVPRAGNQPLGELESTKERLASERLDEVCADLEEELEELKVKYEMYFLGVERMEPARRRDDLKRNIARLKNAFTRNAGLRFRIQALHARYLAYERLWLRSAREKEEGRYRRDILKARRRRVPAGEAKGSAPKRPGLQSEDVDLSDFGAPDADEADETVSEENAAVPAATPEPAPPPARASASVPTPRPQEPARAPASLTEVQMRALYEAYVDAKKRCNEDVSKLTYQAVANSVNKQIPDIVARYKAREVDFQVIIKDGKAVLKAVPRS
ncbi:MAG TPA: MXAN_5187 C-terminal domain-containing protein [Anaeromyxobacteraceae bacterium]|nr:MXAN_5187 C-terminal domain-containing protein [Anaeromyxobacteraceae bacterium]